MCWLCVHSSDHAVLQLRLAGKPGGIQGRGVKFNQRSARSLVLSRHCQHVFASLPQSIDCCSAVIEGRQWDFSWPQEADMARALLAALSHQHLPNLLFMSISLKADAAIQTQAHRSTFQRVI